MMTWQEQVGISEMFIEFHNKYRPLDSVTAYRNFLFEILLYYEDNVLNSLSTGQSDLRYSEPCDEPTDHKSDNLRPDKTDFISRETLDTTERKGDFSMDIQPEAMQAFHPGYLPASDSWPLAGGSAVSGEGAVPFGGGLPWKQEILDPEELETAEETAAMEAAAADAASAASEAVLGGVMHRGPKMSPALGHSGQHRCSLCHRDFSTRFTLTEHWRQHTGEKPFPCHLCSKRFKWRSSLSAHLRIHAGVRAHACLICGRAFTEKTAMVKHMRVHTEKSRHLEPSVT